MVLGAWLLVRLPRWAPTIVGVAWCDKLLLVAPSDVLHPVCLAGAQYGDGAGRTVELDQHYSVRPIPVGHMGRPRNCATAVMTPRISARPFSRPIAEYPGKLFLPISSSNSWP